MKVDKDDVLTFRFRIVDPTQASAFLDMLLETMNHANDPDMAYKGCLVTAAARADVFKERETAEDLLNECADKLAGGTEDDDDLVERIEDALG